MSRKAPRELTSEEQALWDLVRQRATPMRPKQIRPEVNAFIPRKKPEVKEPRAIPTFSLGEKRTETSPRHDLSPSLSMTLAAQPVHMDRKSFHQLKRGKMKPEARIDLHGMTLAQAHPALNRFIFDSHAVGRRLVLVITGKGKDKDDHGPIPVRRGVLKHQVPHWLTSAPLSHMVLHISEAHLKHGGTGAYYIYLRRQR